MVLRDLRVMGGAAIATAGATGLHQASRFRLCSGCRGDYEDPDATADEDEDEADEELSVRCNPLRGVRDAGEGLKR